ncbi:MAG: hypothetical protein Q4B88_05670 [Moraxella sp.]|nr:hypothetical protein [Moraxella sp.]
MTYYIKHPKQPKRPQGFIKNALWASVLSVLLVGCQSLPAHTQVTVPTAAVQTSTSNASESAKQAVTQSLQGLLRRSFSYKTELYASTHLTSTQENAQVADQNSYDYCSTQHDAAYVALAKKAKAAGLDISADDYIDEREALKSDYLACEASHRSVDVLSAPARTTIDDVRQARLTQAYLLDPTAATMTGSYRPLAGVLTALPQIDYAFGRTSVMVNQPIYVDLKAGKLYLWADNLAFSNATWLDKKLGDKWHNKWLMLPLNDGSLPEEFNKTLFLAYADTQKSIFHGVPAEYFSYVTADEVLAELHNERAKKSSEATLRSSQRIIKMSVPNDVYQENRRQALEAFYKTMTERYPVLLEQPDVSSTGETKFDSKAVMQAFFRYLSETLKTAVAADEMMAATKENVLKAEYASLAEETPEETSKETLEKAFETDSADDQKNGVSVMNASESETEAEPMDAAASLRTMYYGLDRAGHLLWLHSSSYKKAYFLSAEPVELVSFTRLLPSWSGEFDRLPKAHAVPNAQNTVNLLDYSSTLLNNLQDSDSVYLKSFLYYLTLSLGVSLEDEASAVASLEGDGIETAVEAAQAAAEAAE